MTIRYGVIVIFFFSVIVTDEISSKVIVINPKVIDTSLLLFYYTFCCKVTKYQVCLRVIPTASNCKQWLSCYSNNMKRPVG